MTRQPIVYELVRILHPEDPDSTLLIAAHEYDPAIHQLASPPATPPAVPPTIPSAAPPTVTRAAELRSLYQTAGWRAIKAIADKYNIERPRTGWDDAIDLIVEAERRAELLRDPVIAATDASRGQDTN